MERDNSRTESEITQQTAERAGLITRCRLEVVLGSSLPWFLPLVLETAGQWELACSVRASLQLCLEQALCRVSRINYYDSHGRWRVC